MPSKPTNGSDYANINFKKFEFESYEAAYPKFTKHNSFKSEESEQYEEEIKSSSADVSHEQYRDDTENLNPGSNGRFDYENPGSNGRFDYESYERNL